MKTTGMKFGWIAFCVFTFTGMLSTFGVNKTIYVSPTSPIDGPGTTWSNAFHTIQAGVDAAVDSDTVLVSNGVYKTGETVTLNSTVSNRVAITKKITVKSLNGPENTFIEGAKDSSTTTNGSSAVRCVYLVEDATLSGFTLTNGCTQTTGDQNRDQGGGGALLYHGGTLTNCIVSKNFCNEYGAGANLYFGGTVIDCTIKNNYAKNNGGGGLLVRNGSVSDSIIENNSANHGGGINCWSKKDQINHCTIEGNFANNQGGGIFSGTLTHCVIKNNTAGDSGGGAFYSTLTDCTVSSNSATYGGGSSEGTITQCKIWGNTANKRGGGCRYSTLVDCEIYSNSAEDSGGTENGTLTHCKVWGNSATESGGGAAWGTLTDCEIYNNTAGTHGGGCYLATLTHCKIHHNTALHGGGSFAGSIKTSEIYENTALSNGGAGNNTSYTDCEIYNNKAINYGATFEGGLTNCIIRNNYATNSCGGCANGNLVGSTIIKNTAGTNDGGTHNSSIKNCILVNNTSTSGKQNIDGGSASYSCSPDLTDGVDGNITNAPLFANVAANDYHLRSNSPGIDQGSSALTTAEKDLDGNPRVIGSETDMGCYESPQEDTGNSPIHYVSLSGGNIWPYTNWIDAATTIQDAVDTASSNDVVYVAEGLYDKGASVVSGVSLTNRVSVSRAITLESQNGPKNTIIVGASDQGDNGSRAIRGVCLTAGATLKGFTISNGWTLIIGDQNINEGAGGVLLYHGGTVKSCIVTDNHCKKRGGGINCHHGGRVLDSIIKNNHAGDDAGGILNEKGTIRRCIISGNEAVDDAGGIYMYQNTIVANCLIKNNRALSNGGGLFFCDSASDGVAEYCTIIGNHSPESAGVRLWNGTVKNCIIYNNDGPNWSVGGNNPAIQHTLTTPLTNIPDGTGCIEGDPQFVNATNAHLSLGSPAIDVAQNATTTDLENLARPLDGNNNGTAIADMGCYEFVNNAADSDGDSSLDVDEIIADTNPTDSNSWFHITSSTNDGSFATISFDSSSKREYYLVSSTNLTENIWTEVIGTRKTGVDGSDFISITNAPPTRFYKLEVERN